MGTGTPRLPWCKCERPGWGQWPPGSTVRIPTVQNSSSPATPLTNPRRVDRGTSATRLSGGLAKSRWGAIPSHKASICLQYWPPASSRDCYPLTPPWGPSPPLQHPVTAPVIRMSFLCRSWTAQCPGQRPPEHTLGQGPCTAARAEHFDQSRGTSAGSLGTILGSLLTGLLTVTMRVKAPSPPSLPPPSASYRSALWVSE